MTRITQINHEWFNNIPIKPISVFRNRFDWAYRCNMHIAIVFPNHRIIYINTHNACITYCYPCTCTEVISNYYITWRAIIYREIFRSRSTVSALPKGGRIPRSRTEISPYCQTIGIAIINLLYNFCIAIGTGNNERAIWENFAL